MRKQVRIELGFAGFVLVLGMSTAGCSVWVASFGGGMRVRQY